MLLLPFFNVFISLFNSFIMSFAVKLFVINCYAFLITANPRITRLIRSEKSSRNTKTRKVNN